MYSPEQLLTSVAMPSPNPLPPLFVKINRQLLTRVAILSPNPLPPLSVKLNKDQQDTCCHACLVTKSFGRIPALKRNPANIYNYNHDESTRKAALNSNDFASITGACSR